MSKRSEEKYSTHHILPSSLGGATTPRNLEVLRVTTHRALHTLFENRMIADQLIRTINFSEKAMRPDVRDWLIETLKSRDITDPYEWYIPEVIV